MVSEDKAGETWQKWHVNWTLSKTGLQLIQEIDKGTEGLVMSRI